MSDNTDAQVIFDAGLNQGDVRHIPPTAEDGRPVIIVPAGTQVKDLERFLERPVRRRGIAALHDMPSFLTYVGVFNDGSCLIFANVTDASAQFTAVLDYHEGGADGNANWGEHRANFACAHTPEWKRWALENGKPSNQKKFATFIEDNIADIIEPAGGDVLEIARTLEAKRSVHFKSGIRLQNGDHQLEYTTATEGKAGANGNLTIPDEFTLALPPFIGGPAYKIRARLRYSIEEGHLTFSYELVNPHKVIETACKEMLERIEKETGIKPLMGSAPSRLGVG